MGGEVVVNIINKKKYEVEWLLDLHQKFCPFKEFEKVPIKFLHDLHVDKAFSTNRKGFIIGISLNRVEGCLLAHFPLEICQFKHMEHLNLFGHGIRKIPDCVSTLTELKSLDLGWNKIRELPESFSKLTKLRSLSLLDNPIEGIPEGLRYLPLKHLYMNAMPRYRGVNVLDHIKLSEIEGEITEDKIRKRMASILPYIR
jgi:hypothetical protein